MLFRTATGVLILFSVGATQVMALDAAAIVSEQCVSCHDVTGPAPSTLQGLLNRKAPDLFYAGSKFKRSWLVEWLRNPTPIRPSGVMFLNHIVVEERKDRIKTDTLMPCPVQLSAAESEAVADYLATLKDGAMKTGLVDLAKKIKTSKARRLFSKQLPCIACHTVRFGKRTLGGVSGPDLRQAGNRLNPDWVYAWIENPQYWHPKTWMPRTPMSHEKRHTLTLLIDSMR
jgi:mono/diheme cytochrome c family protein